MFPQSQSSRGMADAHTEALPGTSCEWRSLSTLSRSQKARRRRKASAWRSGYILGLSSKDLPSPPGLTLEDFFEEDIDTENATSLEGRVSEPGVSDSCRNDAVVQEFEQWFDAAAEQICQQLLPEDALLADGADAQAKLQLQVQAESYARARAFRSHDHAEHCHHYDFLHPKV